MRNLRDARTYTFDEWQDCLKGGDPHGNGVTIVVRQGKALHMAKGDR